MEAVQAGDAEAFTTLFGRHRAALFGYALRMVGRQELAEEVFQETFLSVHRARHTWTGHEGSFRSWLFRIATNNVRDRLRQAARRPEILTDEEPVLPAAVHLDERIALEQALRQLPEPMREAFVLGVVVGLDHKELAEALDVSPDNARARVSRARARLRELLEST